MTLRDVFDIAVDNLWRMKLRAFLTIAGVVIAIGAFVAMVSFGAGAQQNISAEYAKLGLFTTMQVYPGPPDNSDTEAVVPPDSLPKLNDSAVARFQRLPGVTLAYPYASMRVSFVLDDDTLSADAQALPAGALETKMFSHFVAGERFADDSAREVLLTDKFVEDSEFGPADSLIGKTVVISVESSNLDSAVASVISTGAGRLDSLLEYFDPDSLSREYGRRVVRREFGAALEAFIDGYMNRRSMVTDTLTIVGIIENPGGRRVRTKPVLIPTATARRFQSGVTGPQPEDLVSLMQGGGSLDLFRSDTGTASTYSKVTLDLAASANYSAVSDSIKDLGFDTFSFVEQFDEIRKFFIYFDLALGVVGLIALITASLGIVNTMVMSILERRREIGVLKSLGADDRDIRLQFLVESGIIGAIGSVFGIALGWLVSRVVSIIAMELMVRDGGERIDLFALPWWLIAIAFCFGFLVSILAGLYPAARAARVDPVEALRND